MKRSFVLNMSNFNSDNLPNDFRVEYNITQEKAAFICGVSLRTWQRWEEAKKFPKSFNNAKLWEIKTLFHGHSKKHKEAI